MHTLLNRSLAHLFTKERISKERAMSIHEDGRTHRISFAYQHAGQPKRNGAGNKYFGKLVLPFADSVGDILRTSTGISLTNSKYGGVWCSLQNEEDFDAVDAWARSQGTRIFLRDCLDISIALDQNHPGNIPDYTPLGQFEHDAKHNECRSSINKIVEAMCQTIMDIPQYNRVDYIAAVAPRPSKTFDLPTEIAKGISAQLGKTDITNLFAFKNDKGSIKDLAIDQKWDMWEQTGLHVTHKFEHDPSIILIDDKYQSGITMQFVASKLREAGFGNIYGLCAVKTLRDDDNV